MNAENYAKTALEQFQNEINIKYYYNRIVRDKFNLLYININSIRNKLDELELLILEINKKESKNTVHLIALTEIRINEHETQFYNLPHYTLHACARGTGQGGCALYVHETLASTTIDMKSINNIEFLSVNIISLSTVITVVYKQPKVNDDVFIDTLNSYIENKDGTTFV